MCLVAAEGWRVSYDLSGARDVSTPSLLFLHLLLLVMWPLSLDGIQYKLDVVLQCVTHACYSSGSDAIRTRMTVTWYNRMHVPPQVLNSGHDFVRL
jgi:hypothetical protein